MLAATILIAPTSAAAYQYEHVYCSQELGVDGTCPPNGTSEWAHLELNLGNAGGKSHETCIDDWYNEEQRYTEAHCMYYSNEAATQISFGQYGYPRAWNGGSVTHFVYAEEYGYHTDAAASAFSPSLTSPAPTPLVGDSLSAIAGLDPSGADVINDMYPVVIVPGEASTCLLNGPAGMTAAEASAAGLLGGVCGTNTGIEERGLAVTTESPSGAPIVVGLAPRGNTDVDVTNADGTTETVPVIDNVYEITGGGQPTTVTLHSASGAVTLRHVAKLLRPPASAPAGSPSS